MANMIRRVYLSKVLAVLLSVTLLIGVSGALQTGSMAASWVKVGNTLAVGNDISNVKIASANGVIYAGYTLKGHVIY